MSKKSIIVALVDGYTCFASLFPHFVQNQEKHVSEPHLTATFCYPHTEILLFCFLLTAERVCDFDVGLR
jgi:hypothetical protein